VAVSILEAWHGQTAGDPEAAVLTIPGGSDRGLVLVYFAETAATFTFTSITVGGQSPTLTRISVSTATTDNYIWSWFWDETAIAAMSGTTVVLVKTGTPTKHDWDYAVYQDAPNGAEYATFTENASTDTLTPTTTSASTADDFLAVYNNRSSNNRDITDHDNLTQEWQFNTDYTISVADGVGGDDSVGMTGDGVDGNWMADLIHIKGSSVAANPLMGQQVM